MGRPTGPGPQTGEDLAAAVMQAATVGDLGALRQLFKPSPAVTSRLRGEGLGQQLTLAALRLAADLRSPAVYLLTTTAETFFPRFGFETISRTDVPSLVQRSVEFTSACPSGATVMRKSLSTA